MGATYKVLDYALTAIRPMYASFDRGHNEQHFDEVYRSCSLVVTKSKYVEEHLTFEQGMELLLAAIYHDTGRLVCPDNKPVHHGEVSAHIVRNDRTLAKMLCTEPELKDVSMDSICTIIAEHGKHSGKESTSELSLMLQDADNIGRLDKNRAILRLAWYRVDNFHLINPIDIRNSILEFVGGTNWGFFPKSKGFQEVYGKTNDHYLTAKEIDQVLKEAMETNILY